MAVRLSPRICLLIALLFLVWLGVQLNWIHNRRRALKWVESHPGPCIAFTIHPVSAPLSIRILGEESGPVAMGVSVRTPADLQMALEIKRLFPERDIQISDEHGVPLELKETKD